MSGTSTNNDPSPSLDQIVRDLAALRVRLDDKDAECASLTARFSRERLRWRVQTGLAVTVAASALLLSPDNRQAIAQGGLTLAQRVTALERSVVGLQKQAAALEEEDNVLARRINRLRSSLDEEIAARAAADTALEEKIASAPVSPFVLSSDGTTYVLSGYNLQIVDGSGATDGEVNGLGNLIVGYNENWNGRDRTGSHNLVVGFDHGYSSFGGLVAGGSNQVSGPGASVSGGYQSQATDAWSSVSGGHLNVASGWGSSISGGASNKATRGVASVSGGASNTASGTHSSVHGGVFNNATGDSSSVSGGAFGTAVGNYSSVGGGYINTASGIHSSVSGGANLVMPLDNGWSGGIFQLP